MPAPSFRDLLTEFDGRQREHDRRARGVRVLAVLPRNTDVRNLAEYLQTLGGTWHPGSRRVQWPGGSWVRMVTEDRADVDARGLLVDVLVEPEWLCPSASWALDPHGLRMAVGHQDAPAFWGMETGRGGRTSVFAREWACSFVDAPAAKIGATFMGEESYVDSKMLAAVKADMPLGSYVMAGTPHRKSGPSWPYRPGPSTLTISMGTIRIGERDVDCHVSRRGDGTTEVMFAAHPAARFDSSVDQYEVTIGGERVTGIVLAGRVSGGPFGCSEVHLTLREVSTRTVQPGEPLREVMPGPDIAGARADFVAVDEMKPLTPAQKVRLDEWVDGMTRRLRETRKTFAGQIAEARMLSKALRTALSDVDRLPWDLADRKPLRAAAHALCEMAEAATDGAGTDGPRLRPMLGEMLGILRAAEHLPPAAARQMAERTVVAARKAWSGRRA